MKSRIFFLIVALLSSFICLSQSVSGKIIDEKGQPCDYAEVVLISSDSSIVKAELTNDQGNYSIVLPKKGTYLLKVFNFGIEVFAEEILINNTTEKNITINKDINLEEVAVVAKRKLIENKVDRLVFNVSNSIASNGMDLTQVLSMTPMLQIDDFGVSIIGKSGVGVMVNDKMVNLDGIDLINYLRSLRSDDIAKIEVITTPPAKYEAQGNSGLINIVLKKNPKLGWSGNVSTSYTKATYSSSTNGISLNYRSDKINSSLKLRHFHRKMRTTEKIDIIGFNSILSEDIREDLFKGIGSNLSIDYQVNEKSSIGIIYDISDSDSDMDINNATGYSTSNVIDSVLTTTSEHRNAAISQTLSVYNDIKLDDKGKSISIVGNYFSNLPITNVNFITNSSLTPASNKVRNNSDIDYTIWSIQSDLVYPAKWGEIETGLKFTNFTNNSDVSYFDFINGLEVQDATKSNLFEYDEQNIAGYISSSKTFSEKISMKIGLRYEYSIIEGFSPTTSKLNKNKYGNLFPTFYLSYRQSENNNFALSYSRRINRPSFRTLNPFRWYSNPFTYYTGNPELEPSFNNNIEVSYRYKGILSFAAYAQRVSNGYGRTIRVVNGVEKIIDFDNYLTESSIGLNSSLYLAPSKWWESYISTYLYYSSSESSLDEIIPQKGTAFSYSINNTFTLSSKKEVNLLVNFWHYLPARQGNVFSEQLSNFSLGLRFPIVKKILLMSMTANDIFLGTVSKGEIFFEGFTQNYNNYYDGRSFTVSLTYNFGNKKVKGNNKNIRFDEKYRGN
ncbi:MAG: TonB-dependent receptor [Saprospiraceae bacterium]